MWIKNFRHKKLQTLMMFMIIMLCSLLLSASVSILISLEKPFQDFAKECQSATAVLYPYSQKDEEVIALGEQFAKLAEVKRVEYTKTHYVSGELTFEGKKMEDFLKLTEYNEEVYGKIRSVKGEKNIGNKLKENECIIPACLSNKYKINLDDKIKLQLDNKEIVYTVKGVYSEPYNTSTSFDSNILMKKFPKEITGKLEIKIYGKAQITGNQIKETYREKHDGQMNGVMLTLEDSINNSLIACNIVGGVFLAIGIIMLFVSCIIIKFMVQNAMITDAKTIALYKTIGYTSRDILKMYLTFYFIIVSVACILGIGASVCISNTILDSAFENMGQVDNNNILVPGIFCYTMIISFVLGIIYRIIGKTKKVKPVYALNGMSNLNTQKKKEYKGNSTMQFSAFGIALRNLLRSKKSAISIVITSIVTVFSVNFAVISLDVAYTMKENNDYWLGVDKCDVMISVKDSNQYEKVKKVIKEDSRVNYYLRSNMGEWVTMKWKKGMNSTAMSAFVFDDFSKTRLPLVKGRNPEAANEIAIASKVADELNKSIGDYMEIYLEEGKRVDLLITGIFQTYYQLGNACRLTTNAYTENNCNFKYNYFSIYLKDKETMEDFIKDMKEKIDGSPNVIARTEAFSNIMDMIVAPQKNAIPPVVVLVLFVAGINIFCIVLLKNTSNEKTNGIYKCLGYSTGHLILSNLYYVAIVAISSIAVALPMIIVFYPTIMKTSLGMFGFLEYPVNYNYWHITLANMVVCIVFIISTLVSSNSLRKVSVRGLVQE